MKKTVINILCGVLVIPILLLIWLTVQSVMEPVNFNKHKDYRESVAIQRLKDIRELQVAYKNVYGRYASTMDSLQLFYKTGKMKVTMSVGSKDDSLAVANTERLKKQYRNLKPAAFNNKLYELYQAGETNLVFSITTEMAIRDTIFNERPDFKIEELAYIPFSDGEKVIMESVVKKVSGVNVPLFEASMPYKALLKGLEPEQLRINLDAAKEDQGRYKGLQVGSISAPNNNAGNWE